MRLTKVTTSATIRSTGEPVVEIEWGDEDALPFPLCLSAIGARARVHADPTDVSVARGNVVLVDHGRTWPRGRSATVPGERDRAVLSNARARRRDVATVAGTLPADASPARR